MRKSWRSLEDRKRHEMYKKKFGISLEDYRAMELKQRAVCAICFYPETAKRGEKTKRLAVDHCHSTGEVRGLLCMSCNNGLGRFKDDLSRLRNAVEYLINSI